MSWNQQVMRKIDHLLEKKALLDYKYIDFTWSPYTDFFKRLTHDFDQQLYISSLSVSGQNKL